MLSSAFEQVRHGLQAREGFGDHRGRIRKLEVSGKGFQPLPVFSCWTKPCFSTFALSAGQKKLPQLPAAAHSHGQSQHSFVPHNIKGEWKNSMDLKP